MSRFCFFYTCSLLSAITGKTWCGWWWIKSSTVSRRSSTASLLWVTRLTASTLSTCWWRWVTTCGQLRTLTQPLTSAQLWEMCLWLSRGTLTNALWVAPHTLEQFLFLFLIKVEVLCWIFLVKVCVLQFPHRVYFGRTQVYPPHTLYCQTYSFTHPDHWIRVF